MARPGPKAQPDALKVVKGTFQRVRSRVPAVAPLPMPEGGPAPPSWLKGPALKVWHEKVATYRLRNQSIRGCEGALAQYCALEADLVDRRKRRIDIPVALLNAYRIYANEFYDTPASQQVSRPKASGGNRFAGNGRRPTA